jgi:hypothetical protein
MWKRHIEVLGQPIHLNHLNFSLKATLPRFILLRQCWWGEGENRRLGEFFHELEFTGSIVSQVAHPVAIAKTLAMDQPSYRWTLVELGWHEGDYRNGNPPWIADVIVFNRDGTFEDKMARERKARFAARGAAST